MKENGKREQPALLQRRKTGRRRNRKPETKTGKRVMEERVKEAVARNRKKKRIVNMIMNLSRPLVLGMRMMIEKKFVIHKAV